MRLKIVHTKSSRPTYSYVAYVQDAVGCNHTLQNTLQVMKIIKTCGNNKRVANLQKVAGFFQKIVT